MVSFEQLVKLYLLLGHKVQKVELRSGTHPIEKADLSGIAPYLACQTEVAARLMLGVSDTIKARFNVNQTDLAVEAPDGIEVLNSGAALRGLAWVLKDFEDGHLIPLEDDVTNFLKNEPAGEVNVQSFVNRFIIDNIPEALNEWKLTAAPERDLKMTQRVME